MGKTQTAKCLTCGKTYTVTSVVEEAEHGKGAYAKAQKLKKTPRIQIRWNKSEPGGGRRFGLASVFMLESFFQLSAPVEAHSL